MLSFIEDAQQKYVPKSPKNVLHLDEKYDPASWVGYFYYIPVMVQMSCI